MKNRAVGLLVASVILTIALYYVPYGRLIAYPLLLISTVAHEMGHGLAAMLVGGKFESLWMSADGSGAAQYLGPSSRLAEGFVAAAGLIGPAVVACLGFMAGRSPGSARWALGLCGLFLLISVLIWVRGDLFGVFFIGGLGLILVGLAAKASPTLVHFSLIFLCVQLSLSVFSRSDYLFTNTAVTSQGLMPSDVAQMAQALFLPYWFWGLVCGGISLAAVLLGVSSVVSQE